MSPQNETVMKRGEEILSKMGQQKVSLFSKDFWYGSIMDWSMKNESFKTQMFRFVDVLPALQTSDSIARHLKEYFADAGGDLPKVFNLGLGLGKLAPGIMASGIRSNVTQMAKMFIIGESPKVALKALKNGRSNQIAFTIDILGEVTLSEKEAKHYQSQYLELMDSLTEESESWDAHPLLDFDHLGAIPKVNVSVKMTALYSQIQDSAWEQSKTILKDRLRPIFKKAVENNLFVNLDMEHFGVKHLTLEVFKELLIEPELKNYRHFGCVIQAYLKDSYQDILDMVNYAKKRQTAFTVRLVKGAYWDTETIEAKQKSWPVPVFSNKVETDANYEDCTYLLLQNFPHIQIAIGSHNVRSIAYALETAKSFNIPEKAIEIQMLFGMAEPIKKTLTQMGIRVREYCPMGEMLPGMSYLVRRLLENTSNESWLRGKFAENKSLVDLLGEPKAKIGVPLEKIRSDQSLCYQKKDVFYNEPLLDFAISANRKKMQAALQNQASLGAIEVPLIINGEMIWKDKKLARVNPSQISQEVARVSLASNLDADMALSKAKDAWPAWRKKSFSERAAYLDKVADLMLKHRFELIAVQILEVGKSWQEADGDVAEAIDFLRYYAKEARSLDTPFRVAPLVPGEVSEYHYQSRGVTLVISPWNFPLAILAGQVASALVTGNTVIMKPAEQSSRVGLGLMNLLKEGGVPDDVVHFLPGIGEEIGAYLVKHPDISNISFTGSKAVGLWIARAAADTQPNQKNVKRCVIELGGKNAIIVDNDADLDEAVSAVIYSAFGFSGQKCSACSRVIVLADVYDKFLERLIEATRSIEVGAAMDPKPYTGPVVDLEARDRILATIEKAKTQHKWELTLPTPTEGYFVGPTIFSNVDPSSELAQNEIFGPVLAVIKVRSIDEALGVANSTEYALTGGVFSRSPEVIDQVKREFECGNLYINRGITGALVDRHPFGGFKMSGIGSKTGGPDYLLQFLDPRVVTENTMRRGFAPEV